MLRTYDEAPAVSGKLASQQPPTSLSGRLLDGRLGWEIVQMGSLTRGSPISLTRSLTHLATQQAGEGKGRDDSAPPKQFQFHLYLPSYGINAYLPAMTRRPPRTLTGRWRGWKNYGRLSRVHYHTKRMAFPPPESPYAIAFERLELRGDRGMWLGGALYALIIRSVEGREGGRGHLWWWAVRHSASPD